MNTQPEAATPTRMWKSVYGEPAPREVTAERPEWPHRDSEGDQIFVNTHFTDPAKAWAKHLAEHKAGMSLSASRLKEARVQLAELEKHCADSAVLYNEALRAHDDWKREQERVHG